MAKYLIKYDEKVRVIRSEYMKSASIKMLADLYEVKPQTIRAVIKSKTWRHVQ